jgi:TetR/AcrR family transcriptional regulator
VRSPASAPAQSPRQTRRSEARRAAILDAGLSLFSRKGLAGTSAEEIAAAADISKTNLFYYFRSKDDIYVAVLRRLLDDWLDPLRALDVADEPIAALGAYIHRKLAFSRDKPEASRLFCLEIVQGAPSLKEELGTSLKSLVEAKAAVIRAWVDAGRLAPVDPVHLVFAIWATTQHYADFASQIAALTGQGLDDAGFFEATVANVTAILLGGLRLGEAARV